MNTLSARWVKEEKFYPRINEAALLFLIGALIVGYGVVFPDWKTTTILTSFMIYLFMFWFVLAPATRTVYTPIKMDNVVLRKVN